MIYQLTPINFFFSSMITSRSHFPVESTIVGLSPARHEHLLSRPGPLGDQIRPQTFSITDRRFASSPSFFWIARLVSSQSFTNLSTTTSGGLAAKVLGTGCALCIAVLLALFRVRFCDYSLSHKCIVVLIGIKTM